MCLDTAEMSSKKHPKSQHTSGILSKIGGSSSPENPTGTYTENIFKLDDDLDSEISDSVSEISIFPFFVVYGQNRNFSFTQL